MNLKQYKAKYKQPLKQATLCFIFNKNKVLLAMKKRGFGKNRWNGTGGKVEQNETPLQASVRETQEELCITPTNLKEVGQLDFYFAKNPDWDQRVHVFTTTTWQGNPKETEEMAPKWFEIDAIPYKKMWPDDEYWLPIVLERNKVYAEFLFGENDIVLDYKVKKI